MILNFFKPKLNIVEDFFKNISLDSFDWYTISINSHYFADSQTNIQLELHQKSKNKFDKISIAFNESHVFVELIKNSKTYFKGIFKEKSEIESISNNARFILLETIEKIIEKAKKELIDTNNETRKINPTQEELKVTEWQKVSSLTLQKALDKIKSSSDLLFQTTLFYGNKENSKILRLITYNIDFLFTFNNDKSLQVEFFDTSKSKTSPQAKGTLFDAKFISMDYLIELLSKISSNVKIN